MVNIPEFLITKQTTSWENDPITDSLGQEVNSDDWTLKYYFRSGASLVSLTAVANAKGWRTSTTLTSFTSPGTYQWQAVAEKGSPSVTDRILVASGKIIVRQNLADGTYVGTQAEQDLAAVQAAIRALTTGGVKAYTIGNRSMTKMDLPDLMTRESQLKQEVSREQRAEKISTGLGDPNNLFVRFR